MILPLAQLRLVSVLLVLVPIIPVTLGWINDAFVLAYMRGFVTSHYVMAAFYSRYYLQSITGDPQAKTRFYLLLIITLSLFVLEAIPAFVIFGIHITLSECHTIQPSLEKHVKNDLTRKVFNARHFLNGFAYFFMLRNMDPFLNYFSAILLLGVIVSFFYYVWHFFGLRKSAPKKALFDNFMFDMQLIPLVVLSLFVDILFAQFLFYHTYFWLILPFMKGTFKTSKEGMAFLLVTVLITVLWMLLEPISVLPTSLSSSQLKRLFELGAYLHIFTSLATSSMNPKWVLKYFHPNNPKYSMA